MVVSGLFQDLRYALRQLNKAPGLTVAIVVTLAGGIGATAAIFRGVHGVLLRPLPYIDPSRIMAVFEVNTRHTWSRLADPNFDGLSPVAGRVFTEGEDPGRFGPNVVVLIFRLSNRHLARDIEHATGKDSRAAQINDTQLRFAAERSTASSTRCTATASSKLG
jgi:hypothetical protein